MKISRFQARFGEERKGKMKRCMAMLLAGCLAFQTWMGMSVPVHGAEREQRNAVEAASARSILDVEVCSSRIFPYQGKVTVQIDDERQQSRELTFDGGSSSETARFEVAAGDYTVTIRADKFADYTQKVHTEENWISKITVCSINMETGSNAVPGWMRSGDVNGDGQIDAMDEAKLLEDVRISPEDPTSDLNSDGRIDLADLQYLVQNMGESRASVVEKHGVVKTMQPAEGTTAEGMEGFLNHADVVTLRPQNAEASISEENPVAVDFILAEDDAESVPVEGIAIQAPAAADENGMLSSEITDGEAIVVYVDESGQEKTMPVSLAAVPGETALKQSPRKQSAFVKYAMSRAAAGMTMEADGSIVLDFGSQIAVKRVTIKITGTKKTEPLVEIAKVEFVNNMEERIPAPQLNIPVLNNPVSENMGFTVSWGSQTNITGYEVCISGPVKNQAGNETQIVRVSGTQHRVSSINDKKLVNFAEYKVKVRSVNGDWSSPWSEEKTGVPQPSKAPAPPDHVTAEGGYRSISVSWKDMDDANGYMVYYKKRQEADTAYRPVVEGFTPTLDGAGKISGTRYVISGLEDSVEYSVYVTGWNQLGWGAPSIVSTAVTKSDAPPMLPNYMLLNTSNGEGKVTAHITEATYGGHNGAKMIGSPLDTAPRSAWGLVDDNYASYWVKSDWDDGVAYPANDRGFYITLDNDYRMNYITFAAADQIEGVQYARLEYWNSENGEARSIVGTRVLEKRDVNNNPFYIIKFDETVTANKVHICLGRASSRNDMMVGEIRFHMYDSLEDDIMNLYMDEMHTTLREDVTEEVIDGLEARLETPEAISGEKHPLYSELKLEIQTAREILSENLAPSYEVENGITAAKDRHLGFGGLNAWQPLGRSVYEGESLLVYVGHNTKRTGSAANLQLVFTQNHAEASSFARSVNLKVGRNEITVPKITSGAYEHGGQLYVAYTGNQESDQYAIRISGGSSIPALSVYGKTGSERTEAIRSYVEQLEQYVGTIEAAHEEKHTGNKNVDYPYDAKTCVLNTTDIMMREMMYSVPATQVWAGIQNAEDKVAKLDLALQAMEQTMQLFYHHKGLSDTAGNDRGNNAMPAQHLNIRYMRMFAGAFMYASGNHIGIEWNETVLASAPNDMSGFGWGIGHEIGHDINQGTYAVAEVTNNYFAQLLTGKQRFTYANVYDKVTSGSIGRASNVFTQLALYWQLHLAFDNQTDDRHIYDTYEEQFQNLFFARVDTYSRNPGKAPQPGLTLNGGSEQNLMRLACAAAEKNILPFFERWGMQPDEATIAYALQYGEADTKALYYINDAARDYRVAHPDEAGTIKDQDAVTTASVAAKSNQAEITISTDRDAALILGYEISRSMIANGEKKTEVIGFVPIDKAETTVYVDTVSAINNRVLEYEVRAVDQYLNYSNVKSAGSVKIQTDGVIEKSAWTVETDMISEDDTAVAPDEEDPDNGYHESDPGSVEEKKVNSIEKILDNDRTPDGTYVGTAGDAAVITVDMHRVEEVTALKYEGDALADLTIEVSQDGEAWTPVKEHYAIEAQMEEATVWFDSVKEEERDKWIGTYQARYLRLTIAQSGSISIREIEICGPSGDNLEFMSSEDGTPAIGVLTGDYKYGEKAEDVIPSGSLIFTGTYKGNPAYNMVVLYDAQGDVIGVKDGNVLAKQVIFADVPEHGNLGETSDGTWVYYVEPGQWDMDSLKRAGSVRGELYRVDDALTLEGERVVSDTHIIPIPDALPEITLQGGAK